MKLTWKLECHMNNVLNEPMLGSSMIIYVVLWLYATSLYLEFGILFSTSLVAAECCIGKFIINKFHAYLC